VDADERFAHAVTQDFGRCNIAVTVTRTLAEARSFLRLGTPSLDVVVLELRLPDGRGESLLQDIEACPRQPVLVVTNAFAEELAPEAFEYRPVFVGKSMGTAALLKVVRTVVAGYAQPSIRRFATRFRLTQRETEAIAFLAHGAKPKEIATRMRCSEQAVYAYLTRACRRTHCLDYHQLVGRLFEFVCQSLGRTPPEYPAFIDTGQS
jgi:DNA-binding NarL/FixJ family response regulator